MSRIEVTVRFILAGVLLGCSSGGSGGQDGAPGADTGALDGGRADVPMGTAGDGGDCESDAAGAWCAGGIPGGPCGDVLWPGVCHGSAWSCEAHDGFQAGIPATQCASFGRPDAGGQ